MRKITIFLLILCCFINSLPICVSATEVEFPTETTIETVAVTDPADENNTAVDSGSFSLDALQPMIGSAKVSDNVKSAIVYEANSQTLMYNYNADTQMYPASFVKILTALLAVERSSLDSLVTVNQSALDGLPIDAMSADLVVDEVISLSDLVHCLLLGSANDAANVIAEFVCGSQAEFVQMMNDYAKELGCTATYLTNPSGLHDDSQHSTARDVAKIFDAALKNEAFKSIFTKYDYMVPATNKSSERRLMSGSSIQDPNSKLYYDKRVIGSRTGVTNDGRRCLGVAAEANGMLVISIVMGCESVYQEDGYSAITIGGYQETTALLDMCLTGYKTAEILSDGQTLRQISVEGAKNHLVMGPKISLSTVLPEDLTAAGLTFQYADQQLSLPIEKDQYVSEVTVWNGSMCVGQAQLYAMNRVEAAEIVTAEEEDNVGPSALLIVLLIITAAICVFLVIRFSGKIRLFLRRIRRKQHRRNRKRVR